jgi:signal recognition particle GTPase
MKTLTDTQKFVIIKRNERENEKIDKVTELLEDLEYYLSDKDIECEIDKDITSLLEKLSDKADRNYFESKRLSKELLK